MSGVEHTPGPWEIGQTAYCEEALLSPKRGLVAYAAWDGGSSCHLEIENEADAHLIAAAPDLYAALVAVMVALISYLDGSDYFPDFPEWEASANAALSKAAGQ